MLTSKIKITLGTLLQIAPEYQPFIMKHLGLIGPRISQAQPVEIPDWDERLSIITVQVAHIIVQGVLVDNESEVNIMSSYLCIKLAHLKIHPTPFWVGMVDGRKVRPKGIVHHIPIIVEGL